MPPSWTQLRPLSRVGKLPPNASPRASYFRSACLPFKEKNNKKTISYYSNGNSNSKNNNNNSQIERQRRQHYQICNLQQANFSEVMHFSSACFVVFSNLRPLKCTVNAYVRRGNSADDCRQGGVTKKIRIADLLFLLHPSNEDAVCLLDPQICVSLFPIISKEKWPVPAFSPMRLSFPPLSFLRPLPGEVVGVGGEARARDVFDVFVLTLSTKTTSKCL